MRTFIVSFFCLLILSFHAFAQKNIRFRSNVYYPNNTLSNIWGYADSFGREYALVGEQFGVSIVDVTDPDRPRNLFMIPGDTSLWREPKTWSHYAYATNEQGGGLLIIDLANLPANVTYSYWTGGGNFNYTRSHTCFIDNNGILYLNGSHLYNRGSLMLDLKPNPLNPTYLGKYDTAYVHDCFARNDTLWACEIYTGNFSVVDVHNKANPVLLASQNTPFNFTHNCWLSEDGKYLFTTDEKANATVTSYDVSNLSNIKELDQYRTDDYDSGIPHNTYILKNYLYTSYYRAGVTIVDATKPDNLVEVGAYKTSPYPNGPGFEGCWGVYPFLPSGNIICSDRQQGLFVLTPERTRACYLEGTVTNATTGNTLPGIKVEFIGDNKYKHTNFAGGYKTGMVDSGAYDVRFIDETNNCLTKIVSNVQLKKGQTTVLNTTLSCAATGIDDLTNGSIKLWARPNVFQTETTVHIYNPTADQSLTIAAYDLSGRKLKEFEINTENATIEFGNTLPSGMYLLSLNGSNLHRTIKVVKE